MSEIASSIDLEIDGEAREILMSFTLLNELLKAVGAYENLTTMVVDPELREQVLGTFLAERDEKGRVSKAVSVEDANLSIDDANDALRFITEHVANFFVKQLQTQMATGERHGELLKQIARGLGLSGPGLTD